MISSKIKKIHTHEIKESICFAVLLKLGIWHQEAVAVEKRSMKKKFTLSGGHPSHNQIPELLINPTFIIDTGKLEKC